MVPENSSMTIPMAVRSFPLDTLDRLELHDVNAAIVTYRGRLALRLVERESPTRQTDPVAIVGGSHFSDGVIEFALAADRRPEADPGARGFAGIGFRVAPDGA